MTRGAGERGERPRIFVKNSRGADHELGLNPFYKYATENICPGIVCSWLYARSCRFLGQGVAVRRAVLRNRLHEVDADEVTKSIGHGDVTPKTKRVSGLTPERKDAAIRRSRRARDDGKT